MNLGRKNSGYAWNTNNNYTNQLVPLFPRKAPVRAASRDGVETLDPVRGDYTDNATVGKVLLQILGN